MKCLQIKSCESFKDSNLLTSYGRYCNDCKKEKRVEGKTTLQLVEIQCPKCNSLMVIRKRRRDQKEFYGCSRYPRCYGTKEMAKN